MLRLCSILVMASAIFALQGRSLACSLDRNQLGDYPPHTQVRKDLNSDGIPDYFYLAGGDNDFSTCIYLGVKEGSTTVLKLIHEDDQAYDSVLDLAGDGKPRLLVPKMPRNPENELDVCETDLISGELREKATRLYKKWEKGFEEYNCTYGMPEFYPIYNLFLPYEVNVFHFRKNKLIDETSHMKDYLELKKEVVKALLNSKDLPSECRATCEKTEAFLRNVTAKSD